jgi:hypothetical protein
VIQQAKVGARVDEVEALLDVQTLFSMAVKDPTLLLVDIRSCATVSRSARHVFMNTVMTKRVSAVAIVTGDGFGRVIGNFFLSLSAGSSPVRLFPSQDEGFAWLSEFEGQ